MNSTEESYGGTNFSFEIKNIKDWHSKLQREYKRMLEAEDATDHAINFAFTAHHLMTIGSVKNFMLIKGKPVISPSSTKKS